FGYRHYHPRTKQWISRDPIGEAGGLNLFAYANNDPVNGVDILGTDVLIFNGGFWKSWGSHAWNEGPVGGFRKWRNEDAIPTYTCLFLGEDTVGGILREGVPAAHELAVENVVRKMEIRQDQGNSFGYAFFQSAISDPILGSVGVLPIMESWKGYDSLTGEDISTADRYERAGMGFFQLGLTGSLLANSYATTGSGMSSFRLTPVNAQYSGVGAAKEWATTYKPY